MEGVLTTIEDAARDKMSKITLRNARGRHHASFFTSNPKKIKLAKLLKGRKVKIEPVFHRFKVI